MTKNLRPLSLIAAAMIGTLHGAPPVIDAVSERMKGLVDTKEISGAVTLVADGEMILHLSASGLADIGKNQPMAADSILWIASMTKPITATAVMMMQDEGKLSVDDPVSKYLPEFTGDKAGITIKQCLTHSSGLSVVTGDETKGIKTLKELVPQFTAKPLHFPPGSKWQYCQTGINTAARVVEVVSGKAFPEFLQERVFDPLGMNDTSFYPGDAWGLGWGIVREPQGVSAALSPGSFGHGGAYGTQAWIDPVKQRIYQMMIQRADIGNSDASDIRRDFQNAAAQ